MRPINVSLDSTTWELAKGKANFSGWVRRKLLEEVKTVTIPKKKYGSYCQSCDNTYSNSAAFLMECHYCTKCFEKCEYLGELE